MISLLIDTCTNHLIVALYKDKKILKVSDIDVKNDLSSRSLPLIKETLLECNIDLSEINEIIAVNGPGSFTGIRVGITIAKTLAWALNTKIAVISELQLMATTKFNTKYVAPIIDARRGYVYGAIYDKDLNSIVDDYYINLDALKNKYESNDVTFVSYDAFDFAICPNIEYNRLLDIDYNYIDPHFVVPNYIKKTEAEEKRNA